MARTCTVCTHAEVSLINETLARAPYGQVATRFGLDRMTVKRHMVHMRPVKPVITSRDQLCEHNEHRDQNDEQVREHDEQNNEHDHNHGEHRDHREQGAEWDARFDEMKALIIQSTRDLTLIITMASALPQGPLVATIIPDPPAVLVDPLFDGPGISPQALAHQCVSGLLHAWKVSGPRERTAITRFVQEGLQGIASDEEWGA